MAGEQKQFLKQVTALWRREFPFLQPVDLQELPRVPKGCNFLYQGGGGVPGYYYFVCFDFSSKRRGEFSIGVTISQSPERSTLNPAMVDKPTPTSVGSFGIWQFMGRHYMAWALVDLEAEAKALFGLTSGLPKSPDVWRPTTYDQPLEKIVEEAIADVNQSLRKHVLPALQIQAQTC